MSKIKFVGPTLVFGFELDSKGNFVNECKTANSFAEFAMNVLKDRDPNNFEEVSFDRCTERENMAIFSVPGIRSVNRVMHYHPPSSMYPKWRIIEINGTHEGSR